MGIRLEDLKEGCCTYPSSVLNIIDGDSLDDNGSTCDKVFECDQRYILVEEKSFLLGFFTACCKERNKTLGDFLDSNILEDTLFDLIEELDTDLKRRLFAESITALFMSSLEKVSNTTHILATEYDSSKTGNMPIIYLYCKSGKPIDRLASLVLSKLKNEKKQVIVECNQLEKFLTLKGCV